MDKQTYEQLDRIEGMLRYLVDLEIQAQKEMDEEENEEYEEESEELNKSDKGKSNVKPRREEE